METGFHTRKLQELKSFTGLYKIKGLLTLFKVTLYLKCHHIFLDDGQCNVPIYFLVSIALIRNINLW